MLKEAIIMEIYKHFLSGYSWIFLTLLLLQDIYRICGEDLASKYTLCVFVYVAQY